MRLLFLESLQFSRFYQSVNGLKNVFPVSIRQSRNIIKLFKQGSILNRIHLFYHITRKLEPYIGHLKDANIRTRDDKLN